jgi:hypothetical protein
LCGESYLSVPDSTKKHHKMDYVENRMAQGQLPSLLRKVTSPEYFAEAAKPTPSPEVYVPPLSFPQSPSTDLSKDKQ